MNPIDRTVNRPTGGEALIPTTETASSGQLSSEVVEQGQGVASGTEELPLNPEVRAARRGATVVEDETSTLAIEDIFRGPGVVRMGDGVQVFFDRISAPEAEDPGAATDSRAMEFSRTRLQGTLRRAMKRGSLCKDELARFLEEAAARHAGEGRDVSAEKHALLGWLDGVTDIGETPAGLPVDESEPAPWLERLLYSAMTPFLSLAPGWLGTPATSYRPYSLFGMRILSPGRRTYSIQRNFYVDSIDGRDDNPGTLLEPFRTLWPVRWWFALIEILVNRGWSFLRYRPAIYLRRGTSEETQQWTIEEESAASTSLPRMRELFAPLLWEVDRTTLDEAWAGAIGYFQNTYPGTSWVTAYGDLLSFFNWPIFLKAPKGVGGFTLDAYSRDDEDLEAPRILGCWTYDPASEGTWNSSHATLARAMGPMTLSASCTDPAHGDMRAILFLESSEVEVANITFEGFKTGLAFYGVCQAVHIHDCTLTVMWQWGMCIMLVPEYQTLQWLTPTDQAFEEREAWAYWPVDLDSVPCDFFLERNNFSYIGQNSGGAAIDIVLGVSYVEIADNTFISCVDGVMSDGGSSGLHIHGNNFFCGRDHCGADGGDGNAIDLKGVRPRTSEDPSSWPPVDPITGALNIPVEAWTRIYDNRFMGNMTAIVLQKSTGWVHVYNNYIIDNYVGFQIETGVQSIIPCSTFPPDSSREVSDPHGILPAGWDSPLDGPEYVATFASPSTTRLVFKNKMIRLYRNIIAGNWYDGVNIAEGITMMVCERVYDSLDGRYDHVEDRAPTADDSREYIVYGNRNAYGMLVEDLVIANNTIDSNGGIWGNGCGITLSRNPASGSDVRDSWYVGTTNLGAWYLGDHYRRVAIYNNILSNNFYYQLRIHAYSLCQEILSVDPTVLVSTMYHNLVANWDELVPSGIQNYYYIAVDFNSYIDDYAYPVYIATYENAIEMEREGETSQKWFPTLPDDYALECTQYWSSSVSNLYDTAESSGVLARIVGFGLASSIRETAGDRLPATIADYYETLLTLLPGLWLPVDLDRVVVDKGSAGMTTFPDATEHADTLGAIALRLDLTGNPVVGDPDNGALEVGATTATPPVPDLALHGPGRYRGPR